MNWVMYLIKTPLVQVRRDWAEYKALKGQIVQAESDVSHSRGRITLMYDVDDDISYEVTQVALDNLDGAMKERHALCNFTYYFMAERFNRISNIS